MKIKRTEFGANNIIRVCLMALAILTVAASVATRLFAAPVSVTYTYDEAGRLKATTYSGNVTTSYSLDAPGNRKQVTTGPTPPSVPGIPGNPSFTNITSTTATASWTAASGTVTSYEYNLNAGAWINVGAALTANLSGLAAGTGYTVQVAALNTVGTGPASSAGFTTLSLITENATLSEDRYKDGSFSHYGYSKTDPNGNGTGAISPTHLTGGVLYYYDFWDSAGFGGQLVIAGFTADPGATWLVSATGPSATLQGSAATYVYTSGQASWGWTSPFGFGGSGNVAVQVVHH